MNWKRFGRNSRVVIEVLYRNSHGEIEGNLEKPQLGLLVSRPKFGPSTFRM
jgi:hypothetical protein